MFHYSKATGCWSRILERHGRELLLLELTPHTMSDDWRAVRAETVTSAVLDNDDMVVCLLPAPVWARLALAMPLPTLLCLLYHNYHADTGHARLWDVAHEAHLPCLASHIEALSLSA